MIKKYLLIFAFIITLSSFSFCISYPKNIESIKTEECHLLYHIMLNDYLGIRASESVALYWSFWIFGFFGIAPGLIVFSAAPSIEIAHYYGVYKKNVEKWKKAKCE